MELQLLTLPLLALSLLFLITLIKMTIRPKSQNLKLPPGPRAFPIFGNMHHLSGTKPHLALRDLARVYGPLVRLQLGQVSLVVASSKETAEEILKTQDINFASRPQLLVSEILGYGCKDLAFAPYGNYYKQMRRLFVVELLGLKRVKSFTSIRKEEMAILVKQITSECESVVNMSQKLNWLTNAILSRAAFGVFQEKQVRFVRLAQDAVGTANGFTLPDLFPSWKFLEFVGGLRGKLERIRDDLDNVFNEIIEEHIANKANKEIAEEDEDLLDVCLRLKDKDDLEVPLTMDSVKAMMLDAFLAGTGTSSNVVQWTLSELLRNPRVMEKAQKEVRQVLERKNGNIEESDINDLNYLKSVVKETFRIHPLVPLLLPRECRKNCQIHGYDIPEGTRILVNTWAIGRDPKYWDDPKEFKPERFEESSIDYKGTSFEFLPFGAGRRICPGMVFGMASVYLVLANLLFYFDWELPEGMKPKDLDMSEILGAIAERKTDLCLVATLHYPLRNA